jgi:hypothetical protein
MVALLCTASIQVDPLHLAVQPRVGSTLSPEHLTGWEGLRQLTILAPVWEWLGNGHTCTRGNRAGLYVKHRGLACGSNQE